jgi:hypothetical protein
VLCAAALAVLLTVLAGLPALLSVLVAATLYVGVLALLSLVSGSLRAAIRRPASLALAAGGPSGGGRGGRLGWAVPSRLGSRRETS